MIFSLELIFDFLLGSRESAVFSVSSSKEFYFLYKLF